jgi:hypothetical protein
MKNARPASNRSVGAVDPLAIAITVAIPPHASGFQALGACLLPLVRGVSPVVHATASHAVEEVRRPAAAGKAAAHG